MAANNGERTLITALIPPGAAHPNGVFSVGIPHLAVESLCTLSAFLSSLIADYAVRAAPKSGIYLPTINRLPVKPDLALKSALALRSLRLNCVTSAYSSIWRETYSDIFVTEEWACGRGRSNRPNLGAVTQEWTTTSPLRIAEDRRQALIEIDALVALSLGVTADQLCTIYRTQFPVLYDHDHWDDIYDINGRRLPQEVLSVWRKKGGHLSGAERTATNQAGRTYIYELPFRVLDREADMRTAYAEFERRLAAL
jgi:hypothetical protein